MVWVRLSDDALEDPRLVGVSDAAIVAYLRLLGRSNRWALDGRLPRASLPEEIAHELLSIGLVEADGPEHLRLLWQTEYQPTAAEIAERRRKDAGRKGESRDRQRRHNDGDHSKCDPRRCWVLLS
jgi:hypothetical protein